MDRFFMGERGYPVSRSVVENDSNSQGVRHRKPHQQLLSEQAEQWFTQ
jgi:hypothetical protein